MHIYLHINTCPHIILMTVLVCVRAKQISALEGDKDIKGAAFY